MSISRSRQQEKQYMAYLKTVPKGHCDFCAIDKSTPQFIKFTDNFIVFKNRFPYSVWDNQPVLDHLLIAPKTHTDSLGNMTTRQKAEFVDIIEDYEKRGYNVYARTAGNKMKSVVHQHTHLIKIDNRPVRFLLYSRRPIYYRLVRHGTA